MSKLVYNLPSTRRYRTGVSDGVLFVANKDGSYKNGVAFQGLINFNHSSDGGEPNEFYADNILYLNIMSAEKFTASMTCYDTPDAFDECDGTLALVPGIKIKGQARKSFGFAYKSKVGNDTEGDSFGTILYLIYGCLASPSEEEHNTVNDSPEPTELSFDITSTPIQIDNYKSISCLKIESWNVTTEQWNEINNIIYGTDDTYKKTTDSVIDPDKTYYTRSDYEPYVYTKVETPVVEDLSKYYEVDVPGLTSRLLLPQDLIRMYPPTAG